MACTASKLISVAKSQIGYKEGRNNSNKYGAAYGMNNCSWCMIFVWWCFRQAGAAELIKKTASCTACWNAMKSQAVSVSALKPGDIVFFDWDRSGDCDHVGIVEAVGSSRITTIEGNTSSGNSGSQSNGDGVYRRYRTRSQIARAIRPKYTGGSSGSSGTADKEVSVTVLQIKQGSKGNTVRSAQVLLRYRHGYNIDVDGDFGPATDAAVRAFQRAKGLGVDGVVGAKTWAKLVGG